MKRLFIWGISLCSLHFSLNAFAQHKLQFDAPGGRYGILQLDPAAAVGVTFYTFPPGSSTVVTTVTLPTLAWVLGGNTAPFPNILGTLDTTDVRLFAGNAEMIRLIAGGNASFSTNAMPSADNTYTLGTDANRWANVFVNGTSVHIGPSGGFAGNTEFSLGYAANTGTLNVNGGATEVGITIATTDVNNALNVDGATTLNGAVDLGNAAADAITLNGTLTGAGSGHSLGTFGVDANVLTINGDNNNVGNYELIVDGDVQITGALSLPTLTGNSVVVTDAVGNIITDIPGLGYNNVTNSLTLTGVATTVNGISVDMATTPVTTAGSNAVNASISGAATVDVNGASLTVNTTNATPLGLDITSTNTGGIGFAQGADVTVTNTGTGSAQGLTVTTTASAAGPGGVDGMITTVDNTGDNGAARGLVVDVDGSTTSNTGVDITVAGAANRGMAIAHSGTGINITGGNTSINTDGNTTLGNNNADAHTINGAFDANDFGNVIGDGSSNHQLEINGTVDAAAADALASLTWDLAVTGDIAASGIIKSGASMALDGVSATRRLWSDDALNIVTVANDITMTPAGGDVMVTGNVIPSADNTYALGSATNAWSNVYAKTITLPAGSYPDDAVFYSNAGALDAEAAFNYNDATNTLNADIYNTISTGNYRIGGTRVLSNDAVNNVLSLGPTSAVAGTNNTFLGNGAGNASALDANTVVGQGAWIVGGAGSNNTFIGTIAGYAASGNNNTAIGVESARNSTGNGNTYLGYRAGYHITLGGPTASSNTMLGAQTGEQTTTGANNVFVGWNAGSANTTGSSNTYVGYQAGGAAAITNAAAFGNGATATASNTIQLGNGSVTNVNTAGRITSATATHTALPSGSTATDVVVSNAGDLETRTIASLGLAPSGEAFVTIGNTANLSSERAITAGTGISFTDGGANSTLTIDNSGVLSAIGTANQVSVSAATGNVTFSLPQDIATTSTPTFGGMTLNGNLDMTNDLILNIGNAGTDFTATGGLTLADDLDMSNQPILNIGAAGTDFSATGGLTLADDLAVGASFSVDAPTGNTTIAGTVTVNTVTYTFPAAQATAAGQVLSNDGTGILSWATNGSVVTHGVTTPAALAVNTNDYAVVTATATHYRISSSAAVNITGIVAAADGRVIILTNVGANNITLTHLDAGSAAANQFRLPGGANITLGADGAATLIYDATTTKWRVVSTN